MTDAVAVALAELALRVEGASEGSCELDALIWLAVTPGATRKQWSYTHKATGRECEVDETRDASHRLIIVPSYTASLDAALSLAGSEAVSVLLDAINECQEDTVSEWVKALPRFVAANALRALAAQEAPSPQRSPEA